MAFVDEVRIFVKAGDGGKGCESFYRSRELRYPRPDGGDGGKGGDIVFIADSRMRTLLDYRFCQHYKAKSGSHGSSKGKTGRGGVNQELRVPVGTIIRDLETDQLVRDLSAANMRVIAAKGGRGGRGNQKNQTPAPAESGEEKTLHLELKLIADVGLVGLPNAGKSTLITAVSRVRSKIAGYPFTTKQPILGVVKDECDQPDFIVADLPGLIEGAHTGRGLGDRFLKHCERTTILVHVVDVAGIETRDPVEDFRKIESELASYSGQLAAKTKLIVANKMDLPRAQENLKRFRREVTEKIFPVSALNKQGLDPILAEIRRILAQAKHSKKDAQDGSDISS